MGEVINLRNFRKQKARASKDAQAEQNRIRFGRTKGEKLQQDTEKSKAERHLDDHKKEDEDE